MLLRKSLFTTTALICLSLAVGGCETLGGESETASIADSPNTPSKFDPEIYQAALRAESQHNYLEAAQHYQSLLARDSANLELALGLARNLRYAGSGQQAAEVINLLIAREGRTGPLLTELGKAYVSADQMNIAIPILEEARALAPDQWDTHSTLGVAYDYEGRFDEAREAYAAALLLSPQNPDILNNMALSQAQSGDLAGAIATMNLAADQPTASSQVRQNLALLLAFNGDVTNADRWARKDLPREIAEANSKYYRYLASPE